MPIDMAPARQSRLPRTGPPLIPFAALVLLIASAPLAGQSNLVANSGFAPGTLCPGQWSGPCADGFTGTLNSDLAGLRVVSEDDNTILEMTLPRVATAAPHAVATWTGGPVSAQTYEVSVSARSRSLTGRARLVAVAEQESDEGYATVVSAQTELPRWTSTWIRVGLRLEVPSGADRIRVELQGDGSCPTGNCGVITFDNLKVAAADGSRFLASPFENVCREGEFLDVATLECLPRVSEYGFSESEFAAALSGRPVRLVSACTENALRNALADAEMGGGGIVRIPSCEIELTRTLFVPGSTLLEGAGVGNSVLTVSPSACDGRLISVFKRSHVAMRDFSLNGQGCVDEPMSILYSDNVKVERVEFNGGRRNGLIFSYSKRVTLRYNTAHSSVLNNGLSSKDCFLRDDETQVTTATCESRILSAPSIGGSVAPGSVWTQDYSVYSNHLFNNVNDHGLALHAGYGEIAGNLIEDNLRGIKLPDAGHIKIHHNRMRRNELWGIHVYSPIVDRPPTYFVIAQNEFTLNGEFVIRLEGSKDVFLADNAFDRNFDVYYEGNPSGYFLPFPRGANVLRISARQFENGVSVTPETFACSAGQDAALQTSGATPVSLVGSACATYVDNVPPVTRRDTASTTPGTPVSLTPLANDRDADGEELRFGGLVSGPFNGSASVDESALTYTPGASFTGTEVMTYRVEDARGAFTMGEIQVQVAAANRSPVASNDQTTTFQGESVSVAVLQNDSDPDSDPIQLIRIATAPRNGTAAIDGPLIVYTPLAGFLGTDSFVYEIGDGRGGFDSATVTITVSTQPNRNPVARNDTVTTSINAPILIDVLGNDIDPDGDALLFARFVSAPAHGAVNFLEGKVRYQPAAGYTGADSFSYEVADGQGGSSIASVLITVTSEANRAPMGVDDSVAATTEIETVMDVLENDVDPDGDRLFITRIAEMPRFGTATVLSNAILYASVPGFVGADSLVYAISDGRGGESQAMVRISVALPVGTGPQETPSALEFIEVYPNPASGPLQVRFSVVRPAHTRLLVHDLLGRSVMDAPLGIRTEGQHTHTMDVTHLPAGLYLVTLEIEDRKWSRAVGVTR